MSLDGEGTKDYNEPVMTGFRKEKRKSFGELDQPVEELMAIGNGKEKGREMRECYNWVTLQVREKQELVKN